MTLFDLDRYLVDSLAATQVLRRRWRGGPSLCDTIEQQAETIRQLRALLVPPLAFPTRWRLTGQQTRLLAVLVAAAPRARRPAQILALIADDADRAPDETAVAAQIAKMRGALAADGVAICKSADGGRYLTVDAARRIHDLCRAEILAQGALFTIAAQDGGAGPSVSFAGECASAAQVDHALAALRAAGDLAFGARR